MCYYLARRHHKVIYHLQSCHQVYGSPLWNALSSKYAGNYTTSGGFPKLHTSTTHTRNYFSKYKLGSL